MMRSTNSPPLKSAPASGPRVLICEDDPLTALDFADILRNAGWQVVGPTHTAVEALEESYRHLPDLALIDIGLRGMIDGISVAAELAPLGVPVIFLTGDYQRAGSEGRELATDILIKPVSEKAILRAVAAALHLDQG
jgi:two-component system, response regulator PdtaR